MANVFKAEINGRPASAADLAPLAFLGFAHFTAMQVRDGRVRGLDLHLERLRSASLAFFGRAMPDERVRDHLRTAIGGGPADVSLSATMFSRGGEHKPVGSPDDPAILVRTFEASNGPAGQLRLALYEHERWCPGIKHTGEAAKTVLLRQAASEGCDDAAFVDRAGRLSEATIWNLAFWDGDAVIWPDADVLTGTTMGIVRRQLDKLGVAQRSEPITRGKLEELAGCVVMNSWTPGVAVSAIGGTELPVSLSFVDLLHKAYRAEAELTV